MTTHRFVATEWHNVLGTRPPAFTIASGDTVITETLDAWGFDKDGVQRQPGPNPMNGPIFITGADGRAAAPPKDARRVYGVLVFEGDLRTRMETLEARVLREALIRHRWNKTRAAAELGLSRVGLRSKLARYGLEKKS